MNFIKFSRAFKFYDAAPRLISKFSSFKNFTLPRPARKRNLNRIFSPSLYVKEYNFKIDINFDLKEKRCKIKDETY